MNELLQQQIVMYKVLVCFFFSFLHYHLSLLVFMCVAYKYVFRIVCIFFFFSLFVGYCCSCYCFGLRFICSHIVLGVFGLVMARTSYDIRITNMSVAI